jgi:hypothetical protein
MTRLPRQGEATVERREEGYCVVAGDDMIAGPFATDEMAWHWIDRNETREPWQHEKRGGRRLWGHPRRALKQASEVRQWLVLAGTGHSQIQIRPLRGL